LPAEDSILQKVRTNRMRQLRNPNELYHSVEWMERRVAEQEKTLDALTANMARQAIAYDLLVQQILAILNSSGFSPGPPEAA